MDYVIVALVSASLTALALVSGKCVRKDCRKVRVFAKEARDEFFACYVSYSEYPTKMELQVLYEWGIAALGDNTLTMKGDLGF